MWWQQPQQPPPPPPQFQPQFSPSQPIHPSSQPSPLSYPPPPQPVGYPSAELAHTQFQYSPAVDGGPTQPQWMSINMDGMPTAKVPLVGHLPSSGIAPKQHLDMMGKPEAPHPLVPRGNPVTQYPPHVTPTAVTCTNSPFSVEYLLHKQTPPDSGGTYDQRAQLAMHSPEHFNQSAYSHMDSYRQHQPNVPAQQVMAGYVPHEGSMSSMLPSSQVVAVSDPLQSPRDPHMAACTPQDQFTISTNKLPPFSSYTVKPSLQQTNSEASDKLDISLPPAERPYSPPQLVPVEEEEPPDNNKLSSQSPYSDCHQRVNASSPKLGPVSQCRKTSQTSSSDTMEDQSFSTKPFQLGMSPQQVPTSNLASLASVIKASTHSSATSPPPLVPIVQATHHQQRRGSASDDDDDVFFPALANQSNFTKDSDTTEKIQEQHSSIASGSSSSNPPLLASMSPSAPAREGAITPTITPSVVTKLNQTPPSTLVVNRRGRAAGKILDEEKLKLPINRGWQRIVRTRAAADPSAPPRVDICYVTPCKRRLRTFPEIQRYLDTNGIPELTIDHFTFSKKVNIGIVIDERNMTEAPPESFPVSKRRGRPPKHARLLQFMESKAQKDVIQEDISSLSASNRISLEPHEIKTRDNKMLVQEPDNNATLIAVMKEQIQPSTVEGTMAASSFSYDSGQQSSTATVVIACVEQGAMQDSPSLPPSLTSTGSTPGDALSTKKKQPRKRKLVAQDGRLPPPLTVALPPGIKKPRGRPKGTPNKPKAIDGHLVAGGIRRIRKPKHITHILPLPSSSTDQSPANTDLSTAPPVSVITSLHLPQQVNESTGVVPGSTSSSSPLSTGVHHVKVRRGMDDKNKRRQLLLKARADRVRKKAEGQLAQRVSSQHRRVAQQARRERERSVLKQVKDRQDQLSKQRETEWREIRRSRLARQRQVENQQRARERTMRILSQLKKQEKERDRITHLRQQEMERAEQLRRPTEDLLVRDLNTLPTLPSLVWMRLPPKSFSDLLMVFEFGNSFNEFLELERVPGLVELYSGLYNVEQSVDSLLQLTTHLVKALALETRTKLQTHSGWSLREVEVEQDTLSEVLRIYISDQDDHSLSQVCCTLEQFPFQTLRPSEKTAVLAYLVDQLLNSSTLCREIDNRMEQISTLRREKWKISLKLKRFQSRLSDVFGVRTPHKPIVYCGRGRPPKRAIMNSGMGQQDGDSSDDGEEEEGQTTATANGNGGEQEGSEGSDISDEESDEEAPSNKEELQQRCAALKKKFITVRSHIHRATKMMRKFPLGQDRFTRQYWNMPSVGGLMIEGVETAYNEYLDEMTIRLGKDENEEKTKNKPSVSMKVVERANDGKTAVDTVQTSLASGQSSPWTVTIEEPSSAPPTLVPNEQEMDIDVTSTSPPPPSHSHTDHQTPPPQAPAPTEEVPDLPVADQENSEAQANQTVTESQCEPISSSAQNDFSDPSQPPPSTTTSTSTPLNTAINQTAPTDITTSTITTSTSTSTNARPVSPSTQSTSDTMMWFSILPRKPCEMLHYVQGDSSALLNQQQTVMVAPQYVVATPGGGYAYVGSGGVMGQPLVQQVQVGYTLVGNTLVPQTQYVVGQNALNLGGQQFMSVGNGQLALANAGQSVQALANAGQSVQVLANAGQSVQAIANAGQSVQALANAGQTLAKFDVGQSVQALASAGQSIQYVTIGGNQYAVVQPSGQQVEEGTSASTNVIASTDREEDGVAAATSQMEVTPAAAVESSSQDSALTITTEQNLTVTDETPSTSDATDTQQQQQQYVTVLLPGAPGAEPQYAQLPADPRVLSGQYSYAMIPQPDGTSQFALVETSTFTAASAAATASSSQAVHELDCPAAALMENDYESQSWCVDITLMYADTPLPFLGKQEETFTASMKEEESKQATEMLSQVDKALTHGWWSITNSTDVEYLLRVLTMRGYREKWLHKNLQKNKDSICRTLNSEKLVQPDLVKSILDGTAGQQVEKMEEKEVEAEEQKVEENKMEDDSKEEEEMDTAPVKADSVSGGDSDSSESEGASHSSTAGDVPVAKDDVPVPIAATGGVWDPEFPLETVKAVKHVLYNLKAMEQRLFAAHLQLKVLQKEGFSESGWEVNPESSGSELVEMTIHQLLKFESCVERRYLKPPLRKKKPRVPGQDTGNSSNNSPEDSEALLQWREAVKSSISASQVAVCISQLDRSIAWEKSPMKVFCRVCHTGDNESLLLLCDSCDRGTHTYCCSPKLDIIPDGDWYCHSCVINAARAGTCAVCESARGLLLHCSDCPKVYHKRCLIPPLTKAPKRPWQCPDCHRQTRRSKTTKKGYKDEMAVCTLLLQEMETRDESWPFLQPVDRKKVPDYYKVIKHPMDFQTVRSKLRDGRYPNIDAYAHDVHLIFDNCSYYNEDESEIGQAGHIMRNFFDKRLPELMKQML